MARRWSTDVQQARFRRDRGTGHRRGSGRTVRSATDASASTTPARAHGTAVPAASAVTPGTHLGFSALKYVRAGLLEIADAEAGPAHGPVVICLHGRPYDIHSFVDVAPILADRGHRVIVPYLRGHDGTRFLSRHTPRIAEQSAVAPDIVAFMDSLKIDKAVLAGLDRASRTGDVIAAL